MCAVPLNEITISTTTDGTGIIGQNYRITCIVLFPRGLIHPMDVNWSDQNGLLSSGNEITVTNSLVSDENITSVLEFNPFRTAHGSQFSCKAMLMSQAPPFNISKVSQVTIIVGG